MIYLHMALQALRRSRVRTALTILGLVIGTAALVLVFSLGMAGREKIRNVLGNFGIDLVWIKPAQSKAEAKLTQSDRDALMHLPYEIQEAYAVAYDVQPAVTELETVSAALVGTEPAYAESNNISLLEGRFLTNAETSLAVRSIVISDAAAKSWFGTEHAIGKSLFIAQKEYLVTGVYSLQDMVGGTRIENRCFIPVTTLMQEFSHFYYDEIVLRLASSADIGGASNAAVSLMESRRTQNGVVRTVNLEREAALADTVLAVFMLVIASIAVMSLLVGGIGVMNILIVTVRERRQEIGIRKAVGASDAQILRQFVAEAVLIAGAGGIAGLLVGTVCSVFASKWIGLSLRLPPLVLLMIFGISLCIGLFFGIYPAKRAAALSPMEALR